MALIKPANRSEKTDFDIYDPDIPMVPALELLEQQQRRLSREEVTCIATALLLLLPQKHEASPWQTAARIDSVNKRF